MKFNLNYTPQKPGFEINHSQKLLLTGSCFSENIGEWLKKYKFNVLNNPSGILFNPLSIYVQLKNCIANSKINPSQIIERGGEHFSFLHHSSVKESSAKSLVNEINIANELAHDFIKTSDFLCITFGSAYYYEHKQLNTVVANCHKQAGTLFEKKLVTVEEIINCYSEILDELKTLNPKIKVLFTVSPVKYLKDGIIENNLSKSTLILSVQQLVKKYSNCFYFPAYELVTDDLRDYRFYKEDLAHPNEQAVQYVWDKFSQTYFSDKTNLLNEKIGRLNTAQNHRMLHNNPEEIKKFKKHISELTEQILEIDPSIIL